MGAVRLLALASLLLLLACKRPPGSAAAPAPEPPPGPPAAAPDPRALLDQVNALKDQIAARPKSVEIMVALGNLYLENQRAAEAIDWYRQAIEAGEKEGAGNSALLGRARARQANAWVLAGDPARGVAGHEANLKRDPRQPDSLFFLGAILAADDGAGREQLRRADALLRRYLSVWPQGELAGRAREAVAPRLQAAPRPTAPAVEPMRSHQRLETR
jgi:cytochrome c-type biogenesis protein CcmH/NrfG